jgi:hypothetical protein
MGFGYEESMIGYMKLDTKLGREAMGRERTITCRLSSTVREAKGDH